MKRPWKVLNILDLLAQEPWDLHQRQFIMICILLLIILQLWVNALLCASIYFFFSFFFCVLCTQCMILKWTSCVGGRHNMPRPPLQVDLWPFDLESGVRVTCNVVYLCANFSLPQSINQYSFNKSCLIKVPRPLCSRLRPDVRDRQAGRQTSDAHHCLMPLSYCPGAGHNNCCCMCGVN